MPDAPNVILVDQIEPMIRVVRGETVMPDSDLAALYGVSTGALNQAVKRNRQRFPDDFCFQLTREEYENLRCQFGISISMEAGAIGPTFSPSTRRSWRRVS